MERLNMRKEAHLPIHHQLVQIWQRVLGVEVPFINESFFDLGGHSQSAPRMLEQVERATGVSIAAADFLKHPTISGLTRILLRQPPPTSLFVSVQKGADRDPFYFFHGDILGAGFYSKRLATLLGNDQPFHISPPIELGENELPRIEELAARKRRALQERQPHGPYLLGGFCVGAVVAYEVARQLEAAGEEVATVLLIEPEIGDILTRSHLRAVDCLAIRPRPAREKVNAFLRGVKKIERLRHVWRSPWSEKKSFAVKNTKKLLPKRFRPSISDNEPQDEAVQTAGNRDWLLGAYHWVLTSYVPKRYYGRVTMLLTDEQFDQTPFILKQWQKAAPQIRVERIPGSHMSCITTHLDEISRKIRAEIDAVRSFMILMQTVGWPLGMLD
jgi:thioesterase domain-containing protein